VQWNCNTCNKSSEFNGEVEYRGKRETGFLFLFVTISIAILYALSVLDQTQIKCVQALTTSARLPKKSASSGRVAEVVKNIGGTDSRKVLVRQNMFLWCARICF